MTMCYNVIARIIIIHLYVVQLFFLYDLISGFLYDISGDYDLPFLVAGILQIVGGCCLFIIPINEFGASRKSSRLTEEHRVDTRE